MQPLDEQTQSSCLVWLDRAGAAMVFGDERWKLIVDNWCLFLQETRRRPGAARTLHTTINPIVRPVINAALWDHLDGLDALSERWPEEARLQLRVGMDGGNGSLLPLVATRGQVGRRRRLQSVWLSLVCFLVWCVDKDDQHDGMEDPVEEFMEDEGGTLGTMGLRLSEELRGRLHTLVDTLVFPVAPSAEEMKEDIARQVQGFIYAALCEPDASVRSNPVLWWVNILVHSAVGLGKSEEADEISRCVKANGMLPPDLGLRGRVEAIRHYSTVVVLDELFRGWQLATEPHQPRVVEEVLGWINGGDNSWLNLEDGARPGRRLGRTGSRRRCWQLLLGHFERGGREQLGGRGRGRSVMEAVEALLARLPED